jgi:hypothetical protein
VIGSFGNEELALVCGEVDARGGRAELTRAVAVRAKGGDVSEAWRGHEYRDAVVARIGAVELTVVEGKSDWRM